MDMKISVEFDISDYIEKWGDEALDEAIKSEIKMEVLRKVKASDEYKEIVKKRENAMMNKLQDL